MMIIYMFILGIFTHVLFYKLDCYCKLLKPNDIISTRPNVNLHIPYVIIQFFSVLFYHNSNQGLNIFAPFSGYEVRWLNLSCFSLKNTHSGRTLSSQAPHVIFP